MVPDRVTNQSPLKVVEDERPGFKKTGLQGICTHRMFSRKTVVLWLILLTFVNGIVVVGAMRRVAAMSPQYQAYQEIRLRLSIPRQVGQFKVDEIERLLTYTRELRTCVFMLINVIVMEVGLVIILGLVFMPTSKSVEQDSVLENSTNVSGKENEI